MLLEAKSENNSQWWLTYSLREDYRNSYFEKHLMRLLSISRKWDVKVQNLLSLELYAVLLDLFYVNGAVRHTAKSNLSDKIEIKRYSPPSLWEIWSWFNCYWFRGIITIYWLEQVQKIFKCSWWNFCKTLLKLSRIWSAGCNSWSIWFWIFN